MNVVWEWFDALPRVTQVWFGASLAVHAAVTLDVLEPEQLVFDASSICHDLELWRLLTSFLYTGGMLQEFHVLIYLYMITLHSSAYEKHPHPVGGGDGGGRTPRADYAFCLGFCTVLTVLSYLVVDYYEPRYGSVAASNHSPLLYPLFAETLVYAVMYLWSRRNPNALINLNMIPIQGQYLPFAHVGLSLALGNYVGDLVHGILVGHAYYYLVHVVPTMTGRHLLSTPRVLVDWLGDDPYSQRQRQVYDHDRLRQRFRDEGATPAHIAAKVGNLVEIRRLAAVDRSMMGARDRNGWQPLHECVRGGHLQVVEFLLGEEDVVNINAPTRTGHTPLVLAESFHGHNHPITVRLRELGATREGSDDDDDDGGDEEGEDDSEDGSDADDDAEEDDHDEESEEDAQ